MRFNLIFRYKKPTVQEALLWGLLLLPFSFGTLTDLLHLPDAVKYICDLCWIGLLASMIAAVPKFEKPVKILLIWVGLFLLFTLMAYIFNFQSFLYYLWGLRNNFRFYVFFFALIVYFRKEYVRTALKLIDILYWVNIAVSLLQYAMGYEQDFLGGVFGVQRGVNGYTNILFLLVTAKSVVYFLNKQESLMKCFAKCGAALLIGAFAELKFFYIEFAIIVIMASLITKFSWRKLLIIVGGIAGVYVTITLLVKLFPDFEDFFSLEGILSSATEKRAYSRSSDLNRLNSIPILIVRFLKNGWKQLFGLGLGNCDTSGFAFLNTPFYTQYSWLRYAYFSVAFIFLEMGFTGLVFYIGFFVLVWIRCSNTKQMDMEDRMYMQISRIAAMCSPLIVIYNSSLRAEGAYLLYFTLALGFIAQRKMHTPLPRQRRLKQH